MQLTNETIKAIMSIAANLQKQYDIMGAPATQNVRNPYPMHKLIVGALPTHRKLAMTRPELKTRIESYGYRILDSSLIAALQSLRARGAVISVNGTKTNRNLGRPQSRYYFAA